MGVALPLYVEHVDRSTCRACRGACCKDGPGTPTPEDFGAPDNAVLHARIVEALRSKLWVFSFFWKPFVMFDGSILDLPEAPSRLALIEPAKKRTGSCVFWSSRGCSIFETRPTGCRVLRPKMGIDGPECELTRSDVAAAVRSWARHKDVVLAAIAAA